MPRLKARQGYRPLVQPHLRATFALAQPVKPGVRVLTAGPPEGRLRPGGTREVPVYTPP